MSIDTKQLKAITFTLLMIGSVVAIAGSGLAAETQRGGDEPTFNPGVGGPTEVVVSQQRPVVYRGEEDIDFVNPAGDSVDPSNLIGVAGDAEGQPLEEPIPLDQALGQYTLTGESGGAGVVVQQPRVTNLSLLNERGVDVADSSIPEDETILVKAEWNFQTAEDLDLRVTDENGNEITGDVITPVDSLSDRQRAQLTGPFSQFPEAVGEPGQRGTGTETVFLQGIGQFEQDQLENTTVDAAYWAIDLSDQDAGQYSITVEGWDDLDQGPASRTATLDLTTENDVVLDLESDNATRGQFVPFTVRGSSAGAEHLVVIEDDDFRNNNVDERVFRDVQDTRDRGTFDSNGDGNADFAWAEVVISEDTGLGEGQIDTTYLDDTNVDVNLFDEGVNVSQAAASIGNPEDDSSLRVVEGGLTIDEPAGTYIAGQEVDVRGTAQQGIDDVALYARDQGDWELLDVNTDGQLNEQDFISVDADGEWEERDVRLSEATDIFAIPGRYRFGVIEAQDATGPNGTLQTTLTTSEFSSGTSEQTSLIVTEPGLGPAGDDDGGNQSNLAVTGDFSEQTTAEQRALQQQQNNTTVQRALLYLSYNGQVATEDGTVDVIGTAPGQDDVLLVMVDSRGRVATEQVTVDDDDIFEEDDISLTTADGRELNEGNIRGIVYALGRDGVVGDGIVPGQDEADDISAAQSYAISLSGRGLTQEQVVSRFRDETTDEAGSDDLYLEDSFRYTDGATSIETVKAQGEGASVTGINSVQPGDTMVVTGVTNRKPDDNTISVDVTQGPSATDFPSASDDQWNFTGVWNVTIQVPEDAQPGSYTLEADDGDNTDIVTFQVTDQAEATPAPGADNETETATATPEAGTETPTAGDGTPAPGTPTAAPSTPLPEGTTASVEFGNVGRTVTGDTLRVRSATLPNGGYVVIHDSSLAGGNVVGSVIGSSQYLPPGQYERVNVTIDRSQLQGFETVTAMLHRDTNNNRQFNFVNSNGNADGPYVVDGEPVTSSTEINFGSGSGSSSVGGPGTMGATLSGLALVGLGAAFGVRSFRRGRR